MNVEKFAPGDLVRVDTNCWAFHSTGYVIVRNRAGGIYLGDEGRKVTVNNLFLVLGDERHELQVLVDGRVGWVIRSDVQNFVKA